MIRSKKYLLNLAIALDQLLNTLFCGDPDETISSRIGKNRNRNLFTKLLARFLDLFQKKHVEIAVEADEGKDASIR